MNSIHQVLEIYRSTPGVSDTLASEALQELMVMEDDLDKCKQLVELLIAKCPAAHPIIRAYAQAVIAGRKEASHE